MNKKILFVAYGGGHINMILPIAKQCIFEGFKVDILGLTGAKLKAESEGIDCLGYKNFVSREEEKIIFNAGENLLNDNHNPDSGIDEKESLSYLGTNWLENETRYGKEVTQRIYIKAKRHSFLPINFLKKVLTKGNYDLLITTNSPKSERAALIAADHLNIKSIRLEDLFFDDNLQKEIIEMLGNDYYSTIGKFRSSPTKIFVMCEYTKRIYEEQKDILLLDTSKKDVVVTGQPILEKIHNNSIKSKIIEQKKDYEELILWAHQNDTIDAKEILNLLENWLYKYSSRKKKLAFKFHPLENEVIKKNIIDQFKTINSNFIVINDEDNICDWISASSLLISQGSTAMLEAFFLKKPTIILDPNSLRRNFPYVLTEISEIVSNADELNSKFENIKIFDKQKYSIVKKRLGFKLNSVKNIIKEIKNIFHE